MSAALNIVAKGDQDFDTAREQVIWNKRLDTARAPDAIVTCQSIDEVVAAIHYARQRGLKVSPRGGGHHYEAAALRDGGLLLDLGGLDFVEIDAEAKVARVGGGVRGGDLSKALAAQGFAFPVGHCVDVGLAGYLLAGGFGWNAGEWGAACANVAAVEIVTASGETALANAHQNADLFWAARGAGAGFFAVVTAFHLQLQPLPPAVHTWRAMFRAEDTPQLVDWLNAAATTADRSVELGCFLLAAPGSGEPAVIVRASATGNDAEDARARVASFASPPTDLEPLWRPKEEPIAFTDLPRLSPMPSGKRVAADHVWSNQPIGDLLLAIHCLGSSSPHSTVDLIGFGGNAPVTLPDDAALSLTDRTGVGIYALWDDPADDEVNRSWVSRVDEALAPFKTGRYVAEADLTLDDGRKAECFAPGVLDRLAAVRARYDPEDRFFAYP